MSRVIAAVAAVFCIILAGCADDPARPASGNNNPSAYKDLTEEWHTLFNLERAYNRMDASACASILDTDNFTFYFNPSDVGMDGIPESWDYAAEMACANNMFGGDPGNSGYVIESVDLVISDIETVQWDDHISQDFPGETLREVDVTYAFTIETSHNHYYISPAFAPQARFVVRRIDGKWKIVEWYDVDSAVLASRAAAGTEEHTLGKVKAVYAGE